MKLLVPQEFSAEA